MEFIDTHTHLNDEAYGDNCAQFVENAIAAGVVKMILPGTSLSELASMKALVAQFPENLKMFTGLHPTELTDCPEAALNFIADELERNEGEYVGVGEIGIDLHEPGAECDVQMKAFERQCQMALHYDLPINIHCRDGLDQTLEVLQGLPMVPRGAFHCFGGTIDDVNRIRQIGDFYFGINGIVTFKNSGLREVLPAIGLNRIILETDSPYLSPVPFRGKVNDSTRIPLIAAQIAQTLGIPIEEVAEVTTASAKRLYGL
jgi:TatD DNase family protein